jgi:hypothetical protein
MDQHLSYEQASSQAAALCMSGDADELAALLARADAGGSLPVNELRFSVATNAMILGQYACAAAAWDDSSGPGCWQRAEDLAEELLNDDEAVPHPRVPDSATAAAAMREACFEIVRLRERVRELEAEFMREGGIMDGIEDGMGGL